MKTVLFRETASGFLWLRQGEGSEGGGARGEIMDPFLCARQRHSNLSGTQFSPQWNKHDEALVTIRHTNARTDLYTIAAFHWLSGNCSYFILRTMRSHCRI